MINLVAKLKKLKSLGASAVKQSLEDEGASFEDIKNILRKEKKMENWQKSEMKNDQPYCTHDFCMYARVHTYLCISIIYWFLIVLN